VRSLLEEMPSYGAPASLDQERVENDAEELIKDIGAMSYLAGADTSVSATMSFFLAMLVYPEVQSKAQAEIDRVIGRERLPEMVDMESLPYVSAVVAESLRWLPVLPMGTSGLSCFKVIAHDTLLP
jgi:cytochrome P450